MSSGAISLAVLAPEGSELAGTYSSCHGCPSDENCCSRVSPHGGVDLPLLFPEDVRAIQQFIGQSPEAFSIARAGRQTGARLMRTTPVGCCFYRNGKCAVYPVRPIDCRLFPFDISEEPDGRLVWIAYTGFCPVDFDQQAHFEEAKRLLPKLRQNLLPYARADTPRMAGEPFVILGNVE